MRKHELWVPGNCTTSRAPQGVTASLALMKRDIKAETRSYRGAGLTVTIRRRMELTHGKIGSFANHASCRSSHGR